MTWPWWKGSHCNSHQKSRGMEGGRGLTLKHKSIKSIEFTVLCGACYTVHCSWKILANKTRVQTVTAFHWKPFDFQTTKAPSCGCFAGGVISRSHDSHLTLHWNCTLWAFLKIQSGQLFILRIFYKSFFQMSVRHLTYSSVLWWGRNVDGLVLPHNFYPCKNTGVLDGIIVTNLLNQSRFLQLPWR